MKMCEDHSQHPASVPYLSHQQVIEFQWSLWALPSALQHIFEILASCFEFVRGSLTGHIFPFFAVDSSNLKDILRRLPNSHVGGAHLEVFLLVSLQTKPDFRLLKADERIWTLVSARGSTQHLGRNKQQLHVKTGPHHFSLCFPFKPR